MEDKKLSNGLEVTKVNFRPTENGGKRKASADVYLNHSLTVFGFGVLKTENEAGVENTIITIPNRKVLSKGEEKWFDNIRLSLEDSDEIKKIVKAEYLALPEQEATTE